MTITHDTSYSYASACNLGGESKTSMCSRTLRFILAAHDQAGLQYIADFKDFNRAMLALESTSHRHPLQVVCAEVLRAANGNIQMWRHGRVQVHVDLVDPTEGFIGGDDIDTVPATLDLTTGEITLNDPKFGHPLLNWSDRGVSIQFNGVIYCAELVNENIPPNIWGTDIVDHIRANGYQATIAIPSMTLM